MRDRAEIRQISRMVRRILTPYPHCLGRYFLAIHATATRSAPSECIFCAGSYLPDNMFAPKMRLSNGSLCVCARAFVICAQFGGKLGEIADRNDDDFPDSSPLSPSFFPPPLDLRYSGYHGYVYANVSSIPLGEIRSPFAQDSFL